MYAQREKNMSGKKSLLSITFAEQLIGSVKLILFDS